MVSSWSPAPCLSGSGTDICRLVRNEALSAFFYGLQSHDPQLPIPGHAIDREISTIQGEDCFKIHPLCEVDEGGVRKLRGQFSVLSIERGDAWEGNLIQGQTSEKSLIGAQEELLNSGRTVS